MDQSIRIATQTNANEFNNSTHVFSLNGKLYKSIHAYTEEEFLIEITEFLYTEWLDDPEYNLAAHGRFFVKYLSPSGTAALEQKLSDLEKEYWLNNKLANNTSTLEEAQKLGCSPQLAQYILTLEYRLANLEDKIK